MAEREIPPKADAYHYTAFISYNHNDRDIALWLRGKLESYKFPREIGRILAERSPQGSEPKKSLKPIFRDRDEMRVGSDLTSEIRAKLRDSEYLIVVCSPNSAQSLWVNEEIKEFRRQGRGPNILTVIVGGEPDAARVIGRAELECFPPSLASTHDESGAPLGDALVPIAADARPQGDGRHNALLKIIATLLQVDYDQLRQREVEKQRRQMMVNAGAFASIVTLIAAVVVFFSLTSSWKAKSDQFAAVAQSELLQHDYAKAELAAANALKFSEKRWFSPRDTDTRKLLLAARLGGVSVAIHSNSTGSAQGAAENAHVFSADGAFVGVPHVPVGAVGSDVEVVSAGDGRVRWKVALPNSAGRPNSMTISPTRNGGIREIAVAWPEGGGRVFRAAVWQLGPDGRVSAMRELAMGASPLGRHSKRIPTMAFHPSRDWIATGSEDSKLVMWDLSHGAPQVIWEQKGTHAPDVHGIAFNVDGSLLGSGGGDYTGKIWETSKIAAGYVPGRYHAREIIPKFELDGHTDSVWTIAFSPDRIHVATAGYDRTIRIWTLQALQAQKVSDKGKEPAKPMTTATLSGHEGTVYALAFSIDSKLLTSGSSDGSAILWDVSGGRMLNRITADQGIVRSVTTPTFENGVHIAGEGGWSVWSVDHSKLVHRLWNGGATVAVLAFDPTGDFLAASGGNDNGRVRVWNRQFQLAHLLDPATPDEYHNGLAFSPNGLWLAAGGSGTLVHVWDRTRPDWGPLPVASAPMRHDGAVWGLCFDRTSQALYSSNQTDNKLNRSQIKRWAVGSWTLQDQTGVMPDSVYALVCDDASGLIAAGNSRAQITLRSMADLKQPTVGGGTTVEKGELNVWSLALAGSVHAIVSGNSNGRVGWWVPQLGNWSSTEHPGSRATSEVDAAVNPTINTVAYDPHHQWIAAGGVGPSVEIYDAHTMHHLRSLRGHDGTIWWVTFDPKGERLAYGGLDGVIRVVDIARMQDIDNASASQLLSESEGTTRLQMEESGRFSYR